MQVKQQNKTKQKPNKLNTIGLSIQMSDFVYTWSGFSRPNWHIYIHTCDGQMIYHSNILNQCGVCSLIVL